MRRFSSTQRSSLGAPAALTVFALLCVWPLCALCVTGFSACKASGESSGDAGPGDASSDVTSVCDEFTEVGAPCSAASSVACFPMCEAGGCFCLVKPGVGPRWDCVIDTTCEPDCAPADEPCGAPADAGTDADAGADADAGTDANAGADADAAQPQEAGE
jgi:hypothetical protein